MNFWYINFEGKFTKDSKEYPNECFFSSCLIQKDSYIEAEFDFFEALSERKINFIEIVEKFPIDTDDLDLEDEENLFWIEWAEETELAGKPTFDTFHLYPEEETPVNSNN